MKRFLKIVLILALFTVAIAYVLFRVLFFDPFGGTRAEFDAMIPSDVDLMLRRRDLEKDFEPFPMPRFFASLRIREEWDALVRTKIYKEIEPTLGIEALFKQAETIPEQMKPLDLMADLIGREAMVVGKWRANGSLAFAAFVRASFRAKFAAEAVKFAVVRKSQGDLIQSYEEKDGVRSLTVNQSGDKATWHLFRNEDVLVAGNDFELVKQIRQLSNGTGQGIYEKPQYRTAVVPPSDIGRPLDFVLDVADTANHLGWRWPPPPESELLGQRFARELLAPERFGVAMGRVVLGHQIDFSTHVMADYAALRPSAGGLFDGASMELADMWRFCGSVFPQKVAATGYVRFDMKEFLRRMESLLDAATRQLISDGIQQLRSPDRQLQPKSTVELLDTFAGLVSNEVAFAIEPDHPYNVPGTPPDQMLVPDPHWGPRVALVIPLADKDLCEQFVDRVWKAISARQGAVANAWTWSYPNGQKFREVKFNASAVDLPTVSFGFLQLMKRECIVITTTGKFLDEIVQQKAAWDEAKANGTEAVPSQLSLMSELQYKQAEGALKGFGQGFVFASGQNLREVIHNLCPVFAETATRPDFVRIRKEIEPRISAKLFAGGGPKDDVDRRRLDATVDAEIDERDREWHERTLVQAVDALRRDVDGLAMLRWATLSWRVNDRDLEVHLRLATPASFPND